MTISYTATYTPEDNKLRLYATARLPRELYDRLRAAGFSWAPKQELFLAPGWSPAREDLLLTLADEIEDEDKPTTERAADRAERFSIYRDKRRDEAGNLADRFDAGPAVFGHQSARRAERLATRHNRHRTGAVDLWRKAEYWQGRTEGVIRSALHKESPAVRRTRILRLEAEQRKHEKERTEYEERYRLWELVRTLPGADTAGVFTRDANGYGFAPDTLTLALRAAYRLSQMGYGGAASYTHPRLPEKTDTISQLLTLENDPITPAEAAALWLDGRDPLDDPDSDNRRWTDHYTNRLAYERAMLAAEGGSAGDEDMEPGGWLGSVQIQGVNKSPVTGRVVSVKIMAPSGWREDGPLKLKTFNIQRLPAGKYRAPTDDERAAFRAAVADRKASEKADGPPAVALVNPTEDDAQKLQTLWNERGEKLHKERNKYGTFEPTAVVRMTQAQYSARSAGDYGPCGTVEVMPNGFRRKGLFDGGGTSDGSPAFKVRKMTAGGFGYAPDAVVVLTDKPQKPIPLEWATLTESGAPAVAPQTVAPAGTVAVG